MSSSRTAIGRARADEAVARRFSRLMRASTSPYGVLSDPPVIALATAITAVTALLIGRMHASPVPEPVLWGFAFAPVALGAAATLALAGSRRRVVDWLARVPFEVGNVNGLLNGVGVNLRIRFEGDVPTRDTLDESLARVHEECFCLEYSETEPEVEVRIGVLDSKLNPARAYHRRFRRVQQIIDNALVPLDDRFVVEAVWVC